MESSHICTLLSIKRGEQTGSTWTLASGWSLRGQPQLLPQSLLPGQVTFDLNLQIRSQSNTFRYPHGNATWNETKLQPTPPRKKKKDSSPIVHTIEKGRQKEMQALKASWIITKPEAISVHTQRKKETLGNCTAYKMRISFVLFKCDHKGNTLSSYYRNLQNTLIKRSSTSAETNLL